MSQSMDEEEKQEQRMRRKIIMKTANANYFHSK
jgi:hypothetical protein